MNLSTEQLEWIVAEVVKRLRAETGCKCKSAAGETTGGVTEISDRVVTVATIERLTGVTTLRTSRRAVVTPAALDELRNRKIRLVRGDK